MYDMRTCFTLVFPSGSFVPGGKTSSVTNAREPRSQGNRRYKTLIVQQAGYLSIKRNLWSMMARIKDIEYFRVPPRWLFVKVTDTEDSYGWGEATLEGHTEAVEVTSFIKSVEKFRSN